MDKQDSREPQRRKNHTTNRPLRHLGRGECGGVRSAGEWQNL